MPDRLYKLAERQLSDPQQANRRAFTWFGLAAAGALIAAIAIASNAHAEQPQVQAEGLMLRPGTWTQDEGGYLLPPALDANPRNWPTDGWYRGAVYTLQSGGDTWEFHVAGGAGWETRVLAVADLDGDRKPDLIVQVGEQETLLLSSRAKAGLNPPAATLAQMSEGGC